MNWAFMEPSGERANLACDSDASAPNNILSRLPVECHDEFRHLLREACDVGARRRLCITQPDRPLLVVDLVPLALPRSERRVALAILNDPTEFGSSYDRLKKQARRNEAILQSSMDGFFVVDEDCHFLEVNDAFCRMTGYTADELVRMRISDLEVDEHANGGVPAHTRTGLHHFPTAHRHKDGHLIHLELSINVLHGDGEKILVGFARDVTERVRAEEEVTRLTRQQKLILDSAAEGIAGVDRRGYITFLNPAAARMLGANARELIGRSAHAVLFRVERELEDCTTPGCPICSVLRNGSEALGTETTFSRVDGTQFPVEYSITSTRSETDAVGAVLNFKDITEQRHAEEERRMLEAQIQQGQKLESLGLLAGGIAHDLNNMLVGIQGNACLALSQSSDEQGVQDRLQRIIGVCERASKVIRQILAYAGHVSCDASPLNLNELVEDMKEFMRAAVPRSIDLETRLDPTVPQIEADGGQLQQVITSLLVNAVEAIGESTGRITLTTACLELDDETIRQSFAGQDLKPGSYAALYIQDTGCGMSPETAERIFDPFFSKKGAGRGLGLSAMRGVVRAHHGCMSVQSEIGKGTRFTVLLPVSERPVTRSTTSRRPTPLTTKSTVLVIDDEAEVREVIKDMLTDRGMDVLAAEDGLRGIEMFKHHADTIDVVLLDMAMPGKSGDEVLEEILAIRPNARVIVSSGFIEESVSSRFASSKPAAFLQKPFTTDTLMERIRGVLDGRRDISRVLNS